MVGVLDYVRALQLAGVTSDSVDGFAVYVVTVRVAAESREARARLGYETRRRYGLRASEKSV